MFSIRRRKKKRSIQTLLIVRLFFILVVVLVALGFYQYNNMKSYLIKSKIELLDSRFKNLEINVILATQSDELLAKNTEYILNKVSGEEICVAVINKDGEVIGKTNRYNGIKTDKDKHIQSFLQVPNLDSEIYLDVINDEKIASSYYTSISEDGEEQIIILREIGVYNNPSGLVQVSTTLEEVKEILSQQIKLYIISAICALIVIAVLGKLVLKHTLKPLNKLTYELDNIDENQLDTRIDSNNGQIEIDILANKFNNMLQRLELSFEEEKKINMAMKNFILDASHELRTPLTSIQGFIEVLQLGAYKDKEKLESALESMMTESKRLSKLVNELLLLIRLEGDISVEFNRENINDIISEIEVQLQILKRDRKLEINLADDMYCMVNKDQVKQVLYNLVQNAINYTDEIYGIISISTKKIIRENDSYIEISVSDNGEGIAEENIPLIFNRLYRVEKHRSRKKGGYGLGLSIVKKIVDNHHGNIYVESKKGKGSTFKIEFKEVE